MASNLLIWEKLLEITVVSGLTLIFFYFLLVIHEAT